MKATGASAGGTGGLPLPGLAGQYQPTHVL